MGPAKPELTKEDDVWVIRVPKPSGGMQEFRCASEQQARHLLLVLTPREGTRPNPS